jgi:hypothetical protein
MVKINVKWGKELLTGIELDPTKPLYVLKDALY